MKIKFKDTQHKNFYMEMADKCKSKWDAYHKALFYILGLSPDCRKNINLLFDFNEDLIKKSGLVGGWHTSGSLSTCRLAFNLWNDYAGQEPEDAEDYTPTSLFSHGDTQFFFEGIKLRFPETAGREEMYQIVDENGNVIEEAISCTILAEGYIQILKKQEGGSYKVEPMPDIIMDV